MKCLTIVVAMSGHGGHSVARKIAEHNKDFRWYDHPKNDPSNPNCFPELKIATNHFRKRFADGSTLPHLFDRIDNFLLDKSQYYARVTSEIEKLSQGKRLIYVCHELPSVIKTIFPLATVIQLLPSAGNLENVINRHMDTHMLYPLQTTLHKIPGRELVLNELYWQLKQWVDNNPLDNNLLMYRASSEKITINEVIRKEKAYQRELYSKQLIDRQFCDISLITDDVDDVVKQYYEMQPAY